MRRLLLAPLLALALLAAPAAPALPPGAQDDAGMGADAPDRREDAWVLPLGTYAGRVEPTPQVGWLVDAGDREDWYAFDVEAGQSIDVALQAVPQPDRALDGGLYYELWTPSGALATLGWAGEVWPFVAHEAGLWSVRVLAYESAWDYTVALVLAPLPGPAGALVGDGWLVASVRIGEGGGSVRAEVTTNLYETGLGPAIGCHQRITVGATWGGCIRIGSLAPHPSLQAPDARETRMLTLPGEGGVVMGSKSFASTRTPGVHHLLAMVNATHGSATIVLELAGDATLLGIREGRSLWTLRPGEFEGGAGASLGGTGAGAALHASVVSEHALVGWFICGHGSCHVERPDGSHADASSEWSTSGGAPGAWRFVRDASATLGEDRHVLVVADVAFPAG